MFPCSAYACVHTPTAHERNGAHCTRWAACAHACLDLDWALSELALGSSRADGHSRARLISGQAVSLRRLKFAEFEATSHKGVVAGANRSQPRRRPHGIDIDWNKLCL